MNALLALRLCKAFGRSFQASLPCLPLPLHRPLHFYNLLKSTSIASPRAKLASLVKGEVLSPEKIRATTGGIAQQPFAPHNLPKPHYPLLCTTTLASLVKGRWIDGKPQTVALLRFACDTSAFLIYQTFCRQDGGIAQQPFAPHNPPKTALSPSLFVMLTSVCTNMFSHPHYPTKTANTLASPRKRGGGTADTNFSLAVQYSDSPAFTILKLFRAVTVGIVSP